MRSWIGRHQQFGLYDQLMVELRAEDPASFTNFMQMVPAMFDELLGGLAPRITKQHTFYSEPLPPGLKLVLTLCHLASGNMYVSMKFAWRVPPCREVCQAIIDEYANEVMWPFRWGFVGSPETAAAETERLPEILMDIITRL
ncbi:hypothetical protein O3P69_020574 [Scylla paramamosain]|uniref:Uncharacterized protein n=1 Tax=Scylla paramamosain TaxID=85552 RepID=A0AAW0TMD9_SCYPA